MTTITPYVDRENLNSGRKNQLQPPLLDCTSCSALRKALGDVGNKTGSVKRVANKESKKFPSSQMKPPIFRMDMLEQEKPFTECRRSSDEECPPIDVMPTYSDDLPDDYEDIWPKADRLSLNELDQLINWRPYGNSALEISSEDEITEHEEEDVDPMKFHVSVDCIPPDENKEMLSFMDDEPPFEFTPLDDDF